MNLATRLPHDPVSVSRARHAVERLESTVGEDTVATIRLLVSELVTNSVRHGHADDAGEIELRVSASRESVRVEVTDSGPGFAPRARVHDQDEGSGWGLHLVEVLSDRWGTEHDPRTSIWFEIDVSGATTAA